MDNTRIMLNSHTLAIPILDVRSSDTPIRDQAGESYGLMLERKCPITGDWFTPSHEDAPAFGFYWVEGTSLEDSIRSNAEKTWNVNIQHISPEGRRLRERRDLEASISKRMEEFYELVRIHGKSEISKKADQIFSIFLELGEEYILEIEALEGN